MSNPKKKKKNNRSASNTDSIWMSLKHGFLVFCLLQFSRNLHSSKLTGKLPSEWGQNFIKLQKLHLYYNELTGSIPESWESMIALWEIRLQSNHLSGAVPSWLGKLEKNATVYFTCNFLTGAYPSVFNDTTWNGNCFDIDTRAHDQKCPDEGSCALGPLGGKEKKSFDIGVITGILVAAIVLLFAISFLIYRATLGGSKSRRRRRDQDAGDWELPQGVQRFTYKEISKASKSFDASYEIGQGGFGKVYVAQLEDGKYVAIKRASDMSFQGTKEFQNEITLLSRLHHRHLVRLEGFCDDRDEQGC